MKKNKKKLLFITADLPDTIMSAALKIQQFSYFLNYYFLLFLKFWVWYPYSMQHSSRWDCKLAAKGVKMETYVISLTSIIYFFKFHSATYRWNINHNTHIECIALKKKSRKLKMKSFKNWEYIHIHFQTFLLPQIIQTNYFYLHGHQRRSTNFYLKKKSSPKDNNIHCLTI